MIRLDNRLLLFALGLAILMLVWGCGQSENIAASKKVTNLWLTAERLPAPPQGMVYELWVSKVPVTGMSIPADELMSMGKFSFVSNDSLVSFLDVNGDVRADSNKFTLSADAHDFETMFISVEQAVDASPSAPGPIMLMQSITGLTDTLRLTFPLTAGTGGLNEATCLFNLQGITWADRDLGGGYGLWFSTYEFEPKVIIDTIGVTMDYDTTIMVPRIDPDTHDTLNRDSLYASYLWDFTFTADTIRLTFGPDSLLFGDSLMHIRQLVRFDSLADSTPPFIRRQPNPAYITDTTTVYVDIFQPEDLGFPVYDDWGWKYQGWVVSLNIPAAAIGHFTPPAWMYKDAMGNNLLPGDTGGLLTTGTFSRIDEPDDANPFTLRIIDHIILDEFGNPTDTTYKVPQVPGEDFLDAAALSAATGGEITSAFNLLFPRRDGTVFISLEPTNRVSDSTNFPLIVFTGTLPNNWGPAENTVSLVNMANYTAVTQQTVGFPRVIVEMIRM